MDYPHVNHLEIEKSMLFMKALMCNAEESKHSGEKAFWIGGNRRKAKLFSCLGLFKASICIFLLYFVCNSV